MPKMKSHRGACKRFKATASGKIKHERMNGSHNLEKKNRKRSRRLHQATILDSAKEKQIRRMILA
ncbi:50S ribosomal protein L35 [Chlorobium phaeobacteroides]|jgi:large subunit ribosomal protein L35|uniref:Large ribosomal subunit protein bL35 n=1 Tax=Chlorobium phaeobacteroides (strain DSM 266 / SMG 266 / 2430) TaxID=290317 RepID=RL35_CHLPD|nr:50S ribosomal protein L35 [Chlorobium phaeobacteroides]A1BJB4.1 RecName: Full=Large ribosomal subunit protein bL35; AltName: Full=50S ribosomal protein L35 [Chlorobium phaeobacteroides DSM 266]ABL66491.1 LSU ribosomal protein L35P [Chlorobium phaeobacteroides DSM 266]MBV5319487.1 50S ribosomal protein L35 [Chlorobium phaeobacteroides]NTW63060.1 50S ribosomal protein L35 [Chlorobiaceae bacterium]